MLRSHRRKFSVTIGRDDETTIVLSDRYDEQLDTMRVALARGSAMPLKACCNAHHVEVVAGDIFATPNSLKSQEGRNLKSPF